MDCGSMSLALLGMELCSGASRCAGPAKQLPPRWQLAGEGFGALAAED